MQKLRLTVGIVLILFCVTLFFGSVPPSPLYFIKVIRETFQSFFIFGTEDKTNWYLTLSDKRFVEAEKLMNKKMFFLARIQLDKAKDYQTQAEELLKTLKNKTNTTYLEDKLNENKEKEKILRVTLKYKVP